MEDYNLEKELLYLLSNEDLINLYEEDYDNLNRLYNWVNNGKYGYGLTRDRFIKWWEYWNKENNFGNDCFEMDSIFWDCLNNEIEKRGLNKVI